MPHKTEVVIPFKGRYDKLPLTPQQWAKQNVNNTVDPLSKGRYKTYIHPSGKSLNYTSPQKIGLEPGDTGERLITPIPALPNVSQTIFNTPNQQTKRITNPYTGALVNETTYDMTGKQIAPIEFADGGQFLRNAGRGLADVGLSSVGLTNVVPDSAYEGNNANNWAKGANAAGKIGQTAIPMVAGAFLGPEAAPLASAGSKAMGSFNPENQYSDPQQSQVPQMSQQMLSQQMNQQQQSRNQGFAYGGQLGVQNIKNKPNAEVEKQENTLNPDGTSTQFNGASHEQGGIPTQLDPNTLIFSDRLKLGGKTFADLNKANNTSKEDKVLEDSKSNKLKQLTANLMKEAKVKQSLSLFQQQEFLKQTKLGNYAKRLGINLPQPSMDNEQAEPQGMSEQSEGEYAYGGMYANGGIHIKPSHEGRFTEYLKRTGSTLQEALHSPNAHVRQMANFANNAKHWHHAYGGIQKYDDGGITPPVMYEDNENTVVPGTTSSFNNSEYIDNPMLNSQTNNLNSAAEYDDYIKSLNNNTTQNPPPGDGMNPNWMNIAAGVGSALASSAGDIYDIKRSQNVPKETYNRVTPTQLDPSADLRYNNQLYRKGVQDLKNNAGGDASTYLGARTALNDVTGMNNSRINMGYQNANAQIENQGKYYNAEVGDRQTIANMQNQAAANNLKSTAYGNIGNTVGKSIAGINKDKNASTMDQETMNLILAQHPEMLQDPAYLQLVSKYKP